MSKLPLRGRLATTVGGAAARASRLAGRGDGSVIGGVIALRLEPGLLAMLAVGRQIVLVTGTNGKTTTTRLITAALQSLGQLVASNAFGANMEAGLAAALGQAQHAPFAVLEVDERYLPSVLAATAARIVVLLNLSRDQMDRAAEIWLVARRWRDALADAPDCRVVANADDPLIAWAAAAAKQVTWVAAGQRWREDSWCCPECGSHLVRGAAAWRCGECGFARPAASWVLDGQTVLDPAGRRHELGLALPGRANRANAVVALAVAEAFGIDAEQALPRLRQVTSVAGRYTTVPRRGRNVRLLLAKNPAGWLEAFDVLEPPPVPVLLAVNAQGPDGRDTSWLWDVDYRLLRGRRVFVAGERRLDLAVRLEADEVAFRLVEQVDDAVDQIDAGGDLDVLANYTAFQQNPGRVRPDDMSATEDSNMPDDGEGPAGTGPARGASSLRLVWVYPDLLSTYGDRGNLLVLERRARLRGIGTDSLCVNADQPVPRQGDIYLIGGGEDLPQILAARRLRADGGLAAAAGLGAVVFAVCAGYQLIGTEFAGEEGQPVPGLEIADLRSGRGDRRAVGEVLADVDPALGLPRLTGFENHQGVTRLGPRVKPLARVAAGVGNGDGTEGGYAGRVLGTYLHGPALVRNPALADLLLGWAAGPLPELPAADEEWGRRLRDERLAAVPPG